jgi:hypothetical protein
MSVVDSGLGAPQGALDLLARAALAPRDKALEAWRTWRRGYDIDRTPWSEVRMLGAVAARLDWLEPDASIRPRILGIRKFLWVQSQICLKHAVGGLAALNCAGIPALLMKGTARIACDPAAARERLIRDVDVLVPLKSQDRAFEALETDGWSLVENGWQARWRQTGHVAAHHAWSLSKGKSEIDLHHFSNHLNRLSGDDDGLWRRSRLVGWQGTNVHVAAPADALLIALAHGVRWSRDRAADWAIDASALLDESHVDWDVFLQEARGRMLHAVLLAGLRYLRDALSKQVPDVVMTALESETTPRQDDELRYYAKSALPNTVPDVRAAWNMAGHRALLRAGIPFPRMSARKSRSPLNFLERSLSVLPGGEFCWYTVPCNKPACDWLVVRVELTFSFQQAGSQVIGQFRAPGLDLGIATDTIRQAGANAATAKFEIEIPGALLALRQIDKLAFQYVVAEEPTNANVNRPLSIEWFGFQVRGSQRNLQNNRARRKRGG